MTGKAHSRAAAIPNTPANLWQASKGLSLHSTGDIEDRALYLELRLSKGWRA